MGESLYDKGMKVRKEVLGSEHVARATSRITEFDADFQRFITETAWGSLWARPDLDRRTRSLVTIAILAALGREELALHLRASQNIGVDPHEIAEVLNLPLGTVKNRLFRAREMMREIFVERGFTGL